MGAASAGGGGSNVGAGRGLHHRRDVLVRLLVVGCRSGFRVRLFRGVTLLGWFRMQQGTGFCVSISFGFHLGRCQHHIALLPQSQGSEQRLRNHACQKLQLHSERELPWATVLSCLPAERLCPYLVD